MNTYSYIRQDASHVIFTTAYDCWKREDGSTSASYADGTSWPDWIPEMKHVQHIVNFAEQVDLSVEFDKAMEEGVFC